LYDSLEPTEVGNYKFQNGVKLTKGGTEIVNWFSISGSYNNAFVTNMEVTEENVAELVAAGRARWKIENENNNTIKNHGYNLEHNYGHGNHGLCEFLFTLGLLSFLIHNAMNLSNSRITVLKDMVGSRKKLWEVLRTMTSFLHFEEWDGMIEWLIEKRLSRT
jgi:hypothetical protein